MRKPRTPPKNRYSFRYVSENMYDILEYNQPWLCVRAHGLAALVVDRRRTAAVAKRTTDLERFDFKEEYVLQGMQFPPAWMTKAGPHHDGVVDADLHKILDDIAQHHLSYIARIIVE